MKKQLKATLRKKTVLSKPTGVMLRKLPTGGRGPDEIPGGGVPEFSFNLIAGAPGCGKTTLAHQIIFANATVQKPALYFVVLNEPALKMLRYQQQYSFFDEVKLGRAVRFINLGDLLAGQSLDEVLQEIIRQVTAASPGTVAADFFRTMARKAVVDASELAIQNFTQRPAQPNEAAPEPKAQR